MDPFVRRLVERLLDPGQPLSRNRHFHTFATPEGQKALAVTRRLKGLGKAVTECVAAGGSLAVRRLAANQEVEVELRHEGLRSRRVATLQRAEFELLQRLPGVETALGLVHR
jgi:hypothetical protein